MRNSHKHHFINSVNKSLKTALLMAVSHDNYDCVQVSHSPETGSHFSEQIGNVLYREGLDRLVHLQVLLQEGADTERVGVKGNTPLMLASWRGHSSILRLIVEYTESHCSINR